MEEIPASLEGMEGHMYTCSLCCCCVYYYYLLLIVFLVCYVFLCLKAMCSDIYDYFDDAKTRAIMRRRLET